MPIKNIDVKTLKKWLENKEALVVDVREPGEHQSIRIPGAKLIPVATITKDKLPELSGKKLVIHCHSGKRSSNACMKLLQEDPALEIYNLEGGISSWSDAGHEVHRSGKKVLPLDQQVQITVGLAVLIFSLLGLFSHTLWIVLSGLLGAGLLFAGLTGNCYLALLLGKMPWNRAEIKEKGH